MYDLHVHLCYEGESLNLGQPESPMGMTEANKIFHRGGDGLLRMYLVELVSGEGVSLEQSCLLEISI